jgi:MFS superfamily sulfate permease-like transporter
MALKPPEEKTVLQRYLPIVEWLPKYDWGGSLRFDVIAALTVWALLVPEAMAYAGIAGVSPEVGLVTAPLALIGYPPIEELEDLLSAALETSVIVTVNQLPTLSETYSDADGGTVSTPGPADGS